MKIATRSAVLGGGLIIAMVAMAGCSGSPEPAAEPAAAGGGSWEDVVEAANQEGEVNVYLASQDAVNQALVSGFEAEYPDIKVNFVRLDSGPMSARVASEVEAGSTTADAVMMADNVLLETNPDWFRSIEELPAYADIPDSGRISDHYVITQTAPFVITYNTDKISEDDMPTTWKELSTSPVLADSLLIDPRVAASFMAVDYFLSEEEGDQVLEAYGKRAKGLSQGAAPGVQQVIAGEASALFPNVREHTDAARAQGAHVDTVIPTPTISTINLWALPEAGENPNAAQVFVNYAMSKDGLSVTCLDGSYQPVAYDDIPGCPQEEPGTTRVLDIYPKITEDVKAHILEVLGLQ